MKSWAFVTTPYAWCVPRSRSLLTTNSVWSTQIVVSGRSSSGVDASTKAGSMLPTAIACNAVATNTANVACVVNWRMASCAASVSDSTSGSGPSSRIEPASTKGTRCVTSACMMPAVTSPWRTAAAIPPAPRIWLIARMCSACPPSTPSPELGMSSSGEGVEGGHALHMRAINQIRGAGGIAAGVRQGLVTAGIMHALVTQRVPFVLAGSIRDDGPLPEVLSDTLAAQDAMRQFTTQATFAVFVATALHAIAVGNMLPAFVDASTPDELRPLTTICVDQTEFVVTKLRDRGTHQAYGVVTNAQDFMHVLRFYVERWEQAQAPATILR